MSAASARRVTVFCGSGLPEHPAFVAAAADLGRGLAERGVEVVYGGAGVGLMGAMADAALEADGRVIGVIPDELAGREQAYGGITELHVVDSLPERKVLLVELADGFVVLPGGLGTLDELFEVAVRAQVGLHDKPIVVVDVEGFFGPLVAFLDHAVAAGLMAERHRSLVEVVASVDDALDRLFGARPG